LYLECVCRVGCNDNLCARLSLHSVSSLAPLSFVGSSIEIPLLPSMGGPSCQAHCFTARDVKLQKASPSRQINWKPRRAPSVIGNRVLLDRSCGRVVSISDRHFLTGDHGGHTVPIGFFFGVGQAQVLDSTFPKEERIRYRGA
jgi:hypothetical protein